MKKKKEKTESKTYVVSHFKLLGVQYFKKLQRNSVEKKLEKLVGRVLTTEKKLYEEKKIHMRPKTV